MLGSQDACLTENQISAFLSLASDCLRYCTQGLEVFASAGEPRHVEVKNILSQRLFLSFTPILNNGTSCVNIPVWVVYN